MCYSTWLKNGIHAVANISIYLMIHQMKENAKKKKKGKNGKQKKQIQIKENALEVLVPKTK